MAVFEQTKEPRSEESGDNAFKLIRRKVFQNLKKTPYPYQFNGIYGIEKFHGRALLASDMGLGKTLMALGWSSLYPERRPVLVVCPASLKYNWQKEIRETLGAESIILSGKKPYKFPKHEYVIINYDILDAWKKKLLSDVAPKIMICDEFHLSKNRTAIRTKACIAMGKKVPYVIGITGTPIDNRPVELFTQLQAINNDIFPSFWDFALRFCGAKQVFGRWEFKGASRVKELNEILKTSVMIRHKKEEVLKDLPEKTRITLPLAVDLGEYKKAETDFIGWLATKDPAKAASVAQAEALAKIGYLKRLAAAAKIDAVIEWVVDFLANTDQKIILFCVHHAIVDRLQMAFAKQSVTLTGKTSPEGRQQAVDKFQKDEGTRVFIGTLKAAGVGITLTAAYTCAFVELGWTPAEHLQAESRPHRIGQKNAVQCYYMLASGTIETKICELIQSKQSVIEGVLDGRETAIEWNVYADLIKEIKKKSGWKAIRP